MKRKSKPKYSTLVRVLKKLLNAYDAGLLAEAEPGFYAHWRKESDDAHRVLKRVREASLDSPND